MLYSLSFNNLPRNISTCSQKKKKKKRKKERKEKKRKAQKKTVNRLNYYALIFRSFCLEIISG